MMHNALQLQVLRVCARNKGATKKDVYIHACCYSYFVYRRCRLKSTVHVGSVFMTHSSALLQPVDGSGF